MSPRLRAVSAALLAVVALVGCGGDGRTTFSPPSDDGELQGAEHIHGLGLNPADGSLMIATHGGLFRSPPHSHSSKRVGDKRQDTMGFTVIGPDEFLGSGHPDLRDNLPPLLGLIRSDDGGRSWDSISLLGKADFHVLRTAGTRIYGVNATDGTLRVSDDGGRTWATRTPPTGFLDLAPAPGRPDHLVASGETGLFASRDAGKTWRPIDRSHAGLLAWPKDDALYLVDAAGRVHDSQDGGKTWTARGAIGGRPAALVSETSGLYVALHTNEIKVSSDGGRTWRLRVAP